MFIVKYNYEAMKRYRRIREYSSHCAKKKKKSLSEKSPFCIILSIHTVK